MLAMCDNDTIADSFVNPHAEIYDLCLHELLHHWQHVRRDRLMPGWADIDAVALKCHLPDLWAWTYDARQGRFTGRLAGERINTVHGKSLRHRPMIDFFESDDYRTYFGRYQRVLIEPSIAIGFGPVRSPSGRRGTSEQIILPLASDGIHGDGIIGVTIHDFHQWDPDFSHSGDVTGEVGLKMRYFPLRRDRSIATAIIGNSPPTARAQ